MEVWLLDPPDLVSLEKHLSEKCVSTAQVLWNKDGINYLGIAALPTASMQLTDKNLGSSL